MFWNRTSLLDATMRLPIVGFTAFWLIREFSGLKNLIGAHPYFEWDMRFQLGVIARVTLLLLLLCFAILHLVRRQPIRKLPGWRPRIDALLGLTTAYFALLLPRPAATPLWDGLSILFMLGGNLFCIFAALDLGRSLSIMPEARRLVTQGVYSAIRHPLYLGETIAFFGVFLQIRSWTAFAIMALQLFFQVRRMIWEETVLATAFAEYGEYRQKTWRLIPGFY